MGDDGFVKVEKEDALASKKKPYRGGYQSSKPQNPGTVIETKKFKGATVELSGYYFDIGPDQADNFKKTIKKV